MHITNVKPIDKVVVVIRENLYGADLSFKINKNSPLSTLMDTYQLQTGLYFY